MDCEDSDLEKWLKKRSMTTKKFALLVGCSRVVIWKVKRGMGVCPYFAKKIYEITEGEIKPTMAVMW